MAASSIARRARERLRLKERMLSVEMLISHISYLALHTLATRLRSTVQRGWDPPNTQTYTVYSVC